jgi:hypothetical protein
VHPRQSDIVFVLLGAASVLVAVLAALAGNGYFANQDAGTLPPSAARAAPATRTVQRPRPKPPAAPLRITIVASAGDCWIAARRGSSTGSVLAERLLSQGEELTLRGRHVWLQLGAPANVAITVDGKPRAVPFGTTELVLG